VAKGKTAGLVAAELQRLEEIKKLVIVAMFSDDELMDRLVLKGGNALDLIHQISTRASVDVDFSMEDDFPDGERDAYRKRVERALKTTFQLAGFEVFDLKMEERPERITPDMAGFWGGYAVEFKLIEGQNTSRFQGIWSSSAKNATRLGQSTRFFIDISRFEYTTGKERWELEGHQIFVYSPAMMVCEKLRAICQQMPEYGPVVKRNRAGAPRARDFIDIHTLVSRCGIALTSEPNLSLLRHVFAAKKVPLSLLERIPNYREFHRADFLDVLATVKAGVKVEAFEFYFDSVVAEAGKVTRELLEQKQE